MSTARAPLLLCLGVCLGLIHGEDGGRNCDGGRHIPAAFVEDDYCDCADGADERTTGACPDTRFECANRPHRASSVFASRVHDGICDCCDGSDEPPSLCANTCVALAREALGGLQRALVRRAERVAQSQARLERETRALRSARDELGAAASALAALQAAAEAAEAAEVAARAAWEARLEAKELDGALQLDRLSKPMVAAAVVRLSLAGGVEGVDTMHELLVNASAGEEMEEVDSADLIEVALEARDSPAAEECSPAHELCGFEADLADLLPFDEIDEAVLREVLDSLRAPPEQTRALVPLLRVLHAGEGRSLDDAAVEKALPLLEPFRDAAAEQARAALKRQQESLSSAREAERRLAPVAAAHAEGAFGNELEWMHLHGECYEPKEGEFKPSFRYKLCPFGEFTQDGRSLGKFSAWQPLPAGSQEAMMRAGREPATAGMLAFEGGASCGEGGAPRSAKLLFECGEEDELLEVSEPATCEYEAWMRTPAACSADTLLRQEADLASAAEAAGLSYERAATTKDEL